ncbi:MAG: hypothetical protein ABFQ65_01510 [Nanoarchaeota archaeon]
MVPKIFVGFAICFLFISLISAKTVFEIQTLPDHEIFITEIDAYSSDDFPLERFQTFTGEKGNLELEYTPQKSTFKLGLLLKNEGKIIIKYKIFDENFHDGEKIKLNFIPNGISVEDVALLIEEESQEEVEEIVNVSEVVVNESESNQTEILLEEEILGSNISAEKNSTGNSTGIFKGILISGNAIYQENKSIVNMMSYGLIAIIIAVPIFLFVKRRKGKMVEHINKIGDLFPKKDDNDDSDDEGEFDKAEADLKKARERIDSLKGDKIQKARQKLIEDEKELMRLRKLGKD